MVSDDQIMKTQTCFLQEMVQKERIQPSTVDLVHLVPFCLSLEDIIHNRWRPSAIWEAVWVPPQFDPPQFDPKS